MRLLIAQKQIQRMSHQSGRRQTEHDPMADPVPPRQPRQLGDQRERIAEEKTVDADMRHSSPRRKSHESVVGQFAVMMNRVAGRKALRRPVSGATPKRLMPRHPIPIQTDPLPTNLQVVRWVYSNGSARSEGSFSCDGM